MAVKDSINLPNMKPLRQSDDIVASLIALRDELWREKNDKDAVAFLKINSCLYRGYPTKDAPTESEIEE